LRERLVGRDGGAHVSGREPAGALDTLRNSQRERCN
jgi:hypothetical protein